LTIESENSEGIGCFQGVPFVTSSVGRSTPSLSRSGIVHFAVMYNATFVYLIEKWVFSNARFYASLSTTKASLTLAS
jgi:hypothetical protein